MTNLLFCVECCRTTPTDYMYIDKAVKRWFVVDNNVNINVIYMDSISRFNSKKVKKKIKEYKKCSNSVKVIYCIDTDDYDSNPSQKELFEKVKSYCKSNNYDFVFFCKDVEHVFLGKQVQKNLKKKEAFSFASNNSIDNVSEQSLSSINICDMRSNLLIVLDKFLERKK